MTKPAQRQTKPVTPPATARPASQEAPEPRPGILDISPYVPGKSRLPGSGPVIKLSSNETPLGPSPAALKAYRAAGASLERYPDGSAQALRQAIAETYGLNPDHIVCGAGSDEILNLLANAYLGPGDEAIYTEHGFLVYRIAILANGATPVIAPERDLRADVDAILERAGPRTKMVFLANPNNPTGTYVPISEVRRLRAGLPDQVLLVLDAAYAEYVRRNDYEAGIELVATTQNTVMTRTFSKIHGLAALRLGWGYCPEPIAHVLNRIRGPFNISAPAIAAGIAAIKDRSHVQNAVLHNEKWRGVLTEELAALGLKVTESAGNFLLITFPGEAERSAQRADAFLNQRRIVLRQVAGYGLPHALRMTIGTAEENRAVLDALRDFMNGGS